MAVRWAALAATASGGLATVTRPAPMRSAAARAKTGSAGVRRTAGDDQCMAAMIFVRLGVKSRKEMPPVHTGVFERLRGNGVQDGNRNADVGHHDVAAGGPPGKQHMAGFLAEKGNGQIGPHRGA